MRGRASLHNPRQWVSRQYGRRAGREVRRQRPGLFIRGHSDILKIMRDPDLVLLHMTQVRAATMDGTTLRLTLEAGKISGVEAIELGPRGRRAVGYHREVEPLDRYLMAAWKEKRSGESARQQTQGNSRPHSAQLKLTRRFLSIGPERSCRRPSRQSMRMHGVVRAR